VGPKKKTSVGISVCNPLWNINSAEMASSEPVFLNAYWAPELTPEKEVPPAYIAWRAGTITLFLLGSKPPKTFKKFQLRLVMRNNLRARKAKNVVLTRISR
jgi:hypothetical protein